METGEDIRILLVDDGPEWRRFMAEILERKEEMAVTTAEGADGARAVLEGDEPVDCVVSDYQMPGDDGVELLSWVRERDPTLPFVLVTGEGSENVASEAVSAGVTDYIQKKFGADQASALARRVRTAVATDRLRRRAAESEERYRTVVEQSTDAVFISRDGTVVFANPSAAELTGHDREDLVGTPWSDLLASAEAAERLRADGEASFEATVRTADGETREGAFSAGPITYDGEPATLCSVRDVTERKERERELRRERDLKAAFRDLMVESSTAEETETAVVHELAAQDGYAFAWVGDASEDGNLDVRAQAGADEGYLDAAAFGSEAVEPASRAARRCEAQFVDVESAPDAAWRDAALERGYLAAAALPLLYDGLHYGVLAVYATDSDPFDAAERELLADMAEALAYAVDSIDGGGVTREERVTGVRVSIDGVSPLSDVTGAEPFETGRVTVRGTVSSADGTELFLTASELPIADLCEQLRDHEDVTDASVSDATAGRLRVTTSAPTLGGVVASHGGAVTGLSFENGVADVRFDLPAERNVRAVIEDLRSAFGGVSVRSVTPHERDAPGATGHLREGLASLTEKQAEALRAAHHAGYFERPRENDADAVADALGISRSTFLQHLRAAQRKAFAALFE